MKNNFKIGDKVKVHPIEWFDKNCQKRNVFIDYFEYLYGTDSVVFNSDMVKLCCGKTFEIVDIVYDKLIYLKNTYKTFRPWMFQNKISIENKLKKLLDNI